MGRANQPMHYNSYLLDNYTPASKVSVYGLFQPSQEVPTNSLDVFVECRQWTNASLWTQNLGTNMQHNQESVTGTRWMRMRDHKNEIFVQHVAKFYIYSFRFQWNVWPPFHNHKSIILLCANTEFNGWDTIHAQVMHGDLDKCNIWFSRVYCTRCIALENWVTPTRVSYVL